MKRRLGLVLLAAAMVAGAAEAAFAQEVSKKKEIAIFRLSHYDWDIPEAALGSIDQELQSVFINLGRFDIIGMSYRLAEGDVDRFIAKIREFEQQNVKIPDKFQMGQEIFTEADMNRLIGSFIVVVPAVTFFDLQREQRTILGGRRVVSFSARIKTSFTFIDVAGARPMAQFFVDTSGSDENRGRAAQNAINAIPQRLEFEITKIPEFQIKTGVLERTGGEVVLELGRNMGIKRGYEFSVVNERVLASGIKLDTEDGLLVIKEVGDQASVGTVLFGDPQVGDQLREVPRLGAEAGFYLDMLLNPTGAGEGFYVLGGVSAVATKGFYDLRPLVGLELPLPVAPPGSLLPAMWVFGFPFNAYIGGEYTIYLRRLQIRPQAGFGLGMLIPWAVDTEQPLVTHVGGFVDLKLSYLMNRDTAFNADLGYKAWFGIYDKLLELLDITGETTYGGVRASVGVSRKL
jgi:hypothetical protein